MGNLLREEIRLRPLLTSGPHLLTTPDSFNSLIDLKVLPSAGMKVSVFLFIFCFNFGTCAFADDKSSNSNLSSANFEETFNQIELDEETPDSEQMNHRKREHRRYPDINVEWFTPVTETNLTLIGKGIIDPKTHDSIAIACVGELDPNTNERFCDQLQNIYYKSQTNQAYYLGEVFYVKHGAFYQKDYWKAYGVSVHEAGSNPEPKEMKSALKKINRGFKKYRHQANKNRHFIPLFAIGISLAPIEFYLAPASWMMAAAGASPMLIPVYTASLLTWCIAASLIENGAIISANSGKVSHAFADQTGWNWAINAKPVSHRNFRLYSNYLINHPVIR